MAQDFTGRKLIVVGGSSGITRRANVLQEKIQ